MHRLGDILVQYGIQHDTGLLPHEWHYHISPRGKADTVQHNRDGQPIYVSLSYSYPYIVCVVDKEPVGIDIEKISQRLDWRTLVTCFSTNEAHQICSLNDFYQIWTQKESFTKLIGEGLIKGLDIYDMTQSHFYQSREVKFKQFIFDQFMVQVCFLGQAPWGYKKVSVFQLLSS